MIKPVEYALSELKSVVVRDSAVDAMCHGAQLAIPGILQISQNLKKGDIVGVYTQKGEAVALAESLQCLRKKSEMLPKDMHLKQKESSWHLKLILKNGEQNQHLQRIKKSRIILKEIVSKKPCTFYWNWCGCRSCFWCISN